MKITDINRKFMQDVRAEIDAALADLGAKYGVQMHAGSGSFGGNQGHFKLEIKIDDPEIQRKADQETFDRFCNLYGLEPQDFGAVFTVGRATYRLTGLNMKRQKWPLRAVIVNEGDKPIALNEMAVPAIIAARKAAAAA